MSQREKAIAEVVKAIIGSSYLEFSGRRGGGILLHDSEDRDGGAITLGSVIGYVSDCFPDDDDD